MHQAVKAETLFMHCIQPQLHEKKRKEKKRKEKKRKEKTTPFGINSTLN